MDDAVAEGDLAAALGEGKKGLGGCRVLLGELGVSYLGRGWGCFGRVGVAL